MKVSKSFKVIIAAISLFIAGIIVAGANANTAYASQIFQSQNFHVLSLSLPSPHPPQKNKTKKKKKKGMQVFGLLSREGKKKEDR